MIGTGSIATSPVAVRFVPITVRDKLSWEQVSTIEVNTPELPGLSIDVGDARHYPFKDATAHFLGYVGAVSEEELDGDPGTGLARLPHR